jgi:hypothetical protein
MKLVINHSKIKNVSLILFINNYLGHWVAEHSQLRAIKSKTDAWVSTAKQEKKSIIDFNFLIKFFVFIVKCRFI